MSLNGNFDIDESVTKSELASPQIQSILKQLHAVHGKSLSAEERERAAIELAANLLTEANRTITHREKRELKELARMMKEPHGKIFTLLLTDKCFRSKKSTRVADQLLYLLAQFGIPNYLSWGKKLSLLLFQFFGEPLAFILVPFLRMVIRRQAARVILPGEAIAMKQHLRARMKEGVRLNINHLGEAILGEEEARRRHQIYLADLKREDIECVSIKISTIYSQIHLIGWEASYEVLAERLRGLYRVAMEHSFVRSDGTRVPKFVNLDMEEYRDLLFTKELFVRVLSEEEFFKFSAGIVLQAYLPDTHAIQKELTAWAMDRVARGGAPIKVRIVKGANLAMERVEASLHNWPQAPFLQKVDADAQFKKMVAWGCTHERAKAVHLGIGSHNLFDIAYALLLRAENRVEKEVHFEMLEGMANHERRVIHKISGDVLLYCPVAKRKDFQSAIAYLIRRLDENTSAENFLRTIFDLRPGTKEWDEQVIAFSQACHEMNAMTEAPRRTQNRNAPASPVSMHAHFENEPDTDFSLSQNRKWAEGVAKKWKESKGMNIPLVIAGKERESKEQGIGYDPAHHGVPLYRFALADEGMIEEAIAHAKNRELSWAKTNVEDRCNLLSKIAAKMREKRGDLLGVMMADGGKTILEGDPEVSEAIDFAEYYLRSMQKMHICKDIEWSPRGTILVAPPWNFPISIPAGGILAALVAGNCVLFKPAPEAVLSGWILANVFWEAGVPKDVLQFINCVDDPVGNVLIKDRRIDGIALTGGTTTALHFLRERPDMYLMAETGGKNAIIVSAMADRDLAVKDIVQSAFGHNGQKCSACSLAVLEKEVYNDRQFLRMLKDAVESLRVGPCWDFSAKITPLIREPNPVLLRGLTTLEEGESWLVKPKPSSENPLLWTPGVKLGVRRGSFTHQTELFGPLLGVMCAETIEHAIDIVNDTPYGLTSGIHTLDEREQELWKEKIEAGNCYINRGVTGAIVQRQSFGGTKASAFGPGAKAGGPNYVMQFSHAKQVGLPQEKHPLPYAVNELTGVLHKFPFSAEELGILYASFGSYAYWAKHFSEEHDPTKIVGQDNILRYRPHKRMCIRVADEDKPLDILRTLAAALSCQAHFEVSWSQNPHLLPMRDYLHHISHQLRFVSEKNEAFLVRLKEGEFRRLRVLTPPDSLVYEHAARTGCTVLSSPVLANGRFELLHYFREVIFSRDYHRYGNLGLRENEQRKAVS